MNERDQSLEAVALAVLFGAFSLFVLLGFSYGGWMPEVATLHGEGMDSLIRYLLITTGVVFVIGHAVLIAFILNYARGRPTDSPRTSSRAERLWSVIPVVVMALISEGGVLVMGLPVWAQLYGELPSDAERIEVTARQFEWLVRYPGPDGAFGRVDPFLVNAQSNPIGLDQNDPTALDDIVLRNVLNVPVDRPVQLLLRSHDVLHSFTVTAFRIKQDIVPGMIGSTQFVPTRTGEFEIGCAELCGLAHYRMRGVVEVQGQEEYQAWLASQEAWFQ